MGDRFGPYELLEPLASGGMARVFRARMDGGLGFEKIVAIKFMLPGFARDPKAVAMFKDEARLAATLNHVNIVGILDFGERNGEYFIAMEYVFGANLRVLVKRAAETRRLPRPEIAAYIAAEIAAGLEHAHGKRDADGTPLHIVHRDISPQNVVVSWEGAVKILDFGIARSAARSFQTIAGTIKGKHAYMSPEQAGGRVVDHRSDLFSLGSVLYELLTGERAFPQPGAAALEKVRLAEYVPPARLRPDIPESLLEILRKALQRDADQRYASASAMLEDLRLFLAEERTRGLPAPDAGAVSRWAQGLFEISDGDARAAEHAEAAPAAAAKALAAEPALLPGWESDDSPPEAARTMPRPVRRPRPTGLASLTFDVSDEVEDPAEEEEPDIDTAFSSPPENGSLGWVLPTNDSGSPFAPLPGEGSPFEAAAPAKPSPFAPPPFAPLPVPLSPGPVPPPATIATPAPTSSFDPVPATVPVPSPSVRPPTAPPSRVADRPSRERISRTGALAATAPASATPVPTGETTRFGPDLRQALILFIGAATGAAAITALFHLAHGRGPSPAPSPTPTPIESATAPPPATTEEKLPETPTPPESASEPENPLAVRTGEKPIGILSISSEPPRAQVLLDGRSITESPALIPNLPAPRRYVVEVRLDGHSPWSREVDVVNDEALQVVAQLVPLDVPGKLRVLVPRGGIAYVDGRLAGKGPATVSLEVSAGPHQLRLKDANGLILREYEVLVTKGRVTELELPPP